MSSNLDKLIVVHDDFGEGIIKDLKDGIITILFNDDKERKFLYPLSFKNKLLFFKDSNSYVKRKKMVSIDQDEKSNIYDDFKSELYNKYNQGNLLYEQILLYMDDLYILESLKKEISLNIIRLKDTSYNVLPKKLRILTIAYLAIIAFKNYDGGFWRFVRRKLETLYYEFDNDQKLESLIRELISDQEKLNDSRHITNVLVHAIVPSKFLKSFFDFAFDIYERNFNYNTEGIDIYSVLLETLKGLKSIIEGQDVNEDEFSLSVTNKTYILIKSTKLAIIHYPKDFAEMMVDIIKMIDEWFYNRKLLNNYPNYYIQAFEEWQEENKDRPEKSKSSDKKEYIPSPTYRLSKDNKIFILLPVINIPENQKDHLDKLKITVQEDENIYELEFNKDYIIKTRIGYLTIEIDPILIENPFIKRKIDIKLNDELIYSTDDHLYRDYIIFNENKKEMNDKRYYDKLVYLIHDLKSFDLEDTSKGDYYKTSVFIADPDKVYNLAVNCDIYFNTMEKPGIYGKKERDVICKINNSCLDVFTSLEYFVFETDLQIENLIFSINKQNYKLNDDNCEVFKTDNYYRYKVILKNFKIRSNILNFKIRHGNNLIYSYPSSIVYDENFYILRSDQIEDMKTLILVDSSFITNKNETHLNLREKNTFDIHFHLGQNDCCYSVNPNVMRHKSVVNDDWKLLQDIDYNSEYLYVSDNIKDAKVVLKDKNYPEEMLPIQQIEFNLARINLSCLKQYANNHDYIYLQIESSNAEKNEIRIYLRPTIRTHPRISINEDGMVNIKFDVRCRQDKVLEYKLIDKDKVIDGILNEHNTISIKDFKPYYEYDIVVKLEDNIFELNSGKELYNNPLTIYDTNSLETMTFEIEEVCFFDNEIEEYRKPKPTAIKFIRKICKDEIEEYSSLNLSNPTYVCKLYKNSRSGLISFKSKAKIFCEVVSNRTNPMITLYLEYSDLEGVGYMKRANIIEEFYGANNFPLDHVVINSKIGVIK